RRTCKKERLLRERSARLQAIHAIEFLPSLSVLVRLQAPASLCEELIARCRIARRDHLAWDDDRALRRGGCRCWRTGMTRATLCEEHSGRREPGKNRWPRRENHPHRVSRQRGEFQPVVLSITHRTKPKHAKPFFFQCSTFGALAWLLLTRRAEVAARHRSQLRNLLARLAAQRPCPSGTNVPVDRCAEPLNLNVSGTPTCVRGK